MAKNKEVEKDEAIKFLNNIQKDCEGKNYIFRGAEKEFKGPEGRAEDRVNSKIYRHPLYKGIFNENTRPVHIEKENVEEVRYRFYSPNCSNIEILTDLQHFGSLTTLIDFSYSLYVALFFACNGSFRQDGELLVLNRNEIGEGSDIDYKTNVLDKFQDSKVIKPRLGQHSRNRVLAQSSVFVHAPEGYIPIDEKRIRTHTIPKAYKKTILDSLAQYHNINQNTMFNDLFGFIVNEKNFESARIFFYKGLAASNDKKFKEAIRNYNKAIALSPRFAFAYNNRGNAKDSLGRHKEAIRDYDKAIRLNPSLAEAYSNRGNAKSSLGRYEEAIRDYDKAVELNPRFASAYYNRGNAKISLGDYKEAIQDYSKAIVLNPNYASAYNNRGFAKDSLGRYEEAIEDYDKAIELNPRFASAYNNRGFAKGILRRYEEAIRDHDKAIELNPDYASAYYNRGNVKRNLGRHDEAIQDYSKAIRLNPSLAEAYSNRGMLRVV